MLCLTAALAFTFASCGGKASQAANFVTAANQNRVEGDDEASENEDTSSKNDSVSTVWVCYGTSAKAYHTRRYCDGLSNCKGSIREMTEQDAINKGRHLCHFCKDGTGFDD